MITIVDFGVGNLESIRNMLAKVGVVAEITARPDVVRRAEKLILPGVGAFDHGIESLRERGLEEALQERVRHDGVPVLGICLGAQLLTEGSDEGCEPGLGWIPGRTVRFDRGRLADTDRVPHMGWADLAVVRESRLLQDLPEAPRFYFVHSYHLRPVDDAAVVGMATHGYPFAAVIERDNILGVQFHPEKSHRYGMQLLRNFAERY